VFLVRADLVLVFIVAIVVHAVAVGPRMPVAIAAGALLALVLGFRLLVDHLNDAVVMLGMLQIVLGSNPITSRLRIPSQGEILLMHLEGIAANTDIRTIAVERLVPQRYVALTPATIVVVVVVSTTAA
jgi:hypothetical protein